MNTRNGDDRCDEFDLESREIERAHPFGPIAIGVRGLDLGNEVLVAGKEDDEDEIAGERNVEKREDEKNDVLLLHPENTRRLQVEFAEERDDEDAARSDE